MARYLRWIVSFVVIILAIFVGFTQFGRLAVDYSLESLGYAVEATGKELDETTLLERHVYRLVVNDLIIEEAMADVDNFQNLLLLETASRSLQEPVELVGYERARLYIGQVMDNKMLATAGISDKSRLSVHYVYLFLQNIYLNTMAYIKTLFLPKMQYQSSYVSDELLLAQAERSEVEGDYQKARELYEKYLERYGKKGGKGLVQISLANIMIYQGDWKDAEKVLRLVVQEYINREEGKIARNLLNRIGILRMRKSDVKKYLEQLEKPQQDEEKDELRLKTALTLLSLRDFDAAMQQLSRLQETQDPFMKQKATFYLGWIHKLLNNFDEAGRLMQSLLGSESLGETMQLAVKAELAEINLKKGELDEAKNYYNELASDAKKSQKKEDRQTDQWVALSQIEQGVVHIQKGDKKGLSDVFKSLETLGIDSTGFQDLKVKLDRSRSLDLRAEAFHRLSQSQIDSAMDLFKAYLAGHPDDAWAYSGLATCYLILNNLDLAVEYALKGYDLLEDAYTASLLAYLRSFQGNSEEALALYEIALGVNPDYKPAKYNLAGTYLRMGDFEAAYEILKGLYAEFKYSSNKRMKSKIINNMGVSFWGTGKEKLAIAAFKEALAINPQFRQASNNLDNVFAGLSPEVASQYNVEDNNFQVEE